MLYHNPMSPNQVLFLIFLSLALLLLAGAVFERQAARRAYDRFNPPGRRVDIGGQRLYFLAMGEKIPGRPTIIMEAGHGDWSRVWRKIMPEISTFARVVAYDRAGMGWSDPGPHPRTPARVVDELHRLLEAAGEEGPYIFVGHSMGGPISRLYTRTYPEEILGLVWVDPAHEDLGHFFSFWPYAYHILLAISLIGAALARVGIVRLAGPRAVLAVLSSEKIEEVTGEMVVQVAPAAFFETVYQETLWMMNGVNWPADPLHLRNLPVISIEALYPNGLPGRYPKPIWEQFKKGWLALHEDLASSSSRLTRIPVQAGHVVMTEQPQVVIDAIRTLYQVVISGQPVLEQPAENG